MATNFKVRIASERGLKPSHKSLQDVVEMGLSSDQFITAEELADQEALPRENVLKILDAKKVWPKAKIVKRGPVTAAHPHGRPLGGRPRLAFDVEAARAAVLAGIEEMYGPE